jgi:hypothetical protein
MPTSVEQRIALDRGRVRRGRQCGNSFGWIILSASVERCPTWSTYFANTILAMSLGVGSILGIFADVFFRILA